MSNIKIDVNQSVTSRLGFEPFEQYDNFCLGFLTSVRVEETTSKEDAKWEYKGMTYKRLVFDFIQRKDSLNTRDRFHTHSEQPVSFTKGDGIDRSDKDITNSYIELWRRIKHILDAYANYNNTKPIDFEVSFDDSKSIEDRIVEFNTFFEKIAKLFNEGLNGKPIYEPYGEKDEKLMVMKLAVNPLSKRLEFPNFVGKGWIEPAVLKNGRVDTGLKFGPRETVVVGATNVPAPPQGQTGSALPEDIQNLINASR